MKRVSIFLPTILIFTLNTIAQDFRQGFIVTLENDTIHGEINYATPAKNYQRCQFVVEGLPGEYAPEQIAAYGWKNDKLYMSGIEQGVFVEVLVMGNLTLFKSGSSFIMSKQNEIVTLDPPTKTLVDQAEMAPDGTFKNVKKYKHDNSWLGKVSYFTGDCNHKLAKSLESLKFREEDLTRYVVEYNQCTGEPVVVVKDKQPWYRVNFGVQVGLVRSEIRPEDISSSYIDFRHLNDSYQSLDPFIGLLFDINSPRMSNRISFQVEVQLFNTKFNGAKHIEFNGYEELHQTSMEYTTVSIPFALKYSMHVGTSLLYLNLGANYDHFINYQSERTTETVRDGVITNTQTGEAVPIRNNVLGGWGGVGFLKQLRRISVGTQLRYHYLSNMGDKHPSSENTVKINGNRISASFLIMF